MVASGKSLRALARIQHTVGVGTLLRTLLRAQPPFGEGALLEWRGLQITSGPLSVGLFWVSTREQCSLPRLEVPRFGRSTTAADCGFCTTSGTCTGTLGSATRVRISSVLLLSPGLRTGSDPGAGTIDRGRFAPASFRVPLHDDGRQPGNRLPNHNRDLLLRTNCEQTTG